MAQTPLFLYHGVKDELIQVNQARDSYRYYDNIYKNTKHLLKRIYDENLDGDLSQFEINTLGQWIQNIFRRAIPKLPVINDLKDVENLIDQIQNLSMSRELKRNVLLMK